MTRSSASWIPFEASMRDMSRPSRGTEGSILRFRSLLDCNGTPVQEIRDTYSDG